MEIVVGDYFAFQNYLVDQIIRAIKFFVYASFNDLFRYMDAATTYGPYADNPAYSSTAFSVTRNGDMHGEVRLVKLIENTLTQLQVDNRVEYCPNAKEYSIADIRSNDGHRKTISHIIFDAFAESENRADYNTLITYVKQNSNYYSWKEAVEGFGGGTINTAAGATKFTLQRLLDLECVDEDEFKRAVYNINFE